MNNFAEKAIQFYQTIQLPQNLPEGIEVMHPHLLPEIAGVSSDFYRKFYSDSLPRTFIIGINPGRFGGGLTGVPFTDPEKLRLFCGIEHSLTGQTELSADFIYQVIAEYGGTNKFYSDFYFTSVVPLGFTRSTTNLNYYDNKKLVQELFPLMAVWMREQLTFGANTDRCICLGSGKNLQYLNKLNEQHHFFKRIDALDHPRFIMQYKRKSLRDYIYKYLEVLHQQ
ncbi:MAG TPA: uracil-DNA glycosylase family protein [Daejeonella sp.]|nr:uracil-DNA glycosylase family protein [Daejeonella sp.]